MQDLMERSDTAAPTISERFSIADAAKGDDGQSPAAKALMGAAAGAIGVWALDRTDWFMWNHESRETRRRTTAVRPGGEPPAHALASKIEQMFGLSATPSAHEFAGDVIHYGIGIAPAILYGLYRDKLPGRGPVRGLLYGIGMFLVQDELMNSASGLAAKPTDYPRQAHARGLVAHLVYGVVTELALNMIERAAESRRAS